MTKTIKSPLTKGVAKVPVVMQLEALECGAACLGMILAYYGKWIPLEQVREDCGVSRDGSNAKNIVKAARSYGLEARGYRYETEDLIENGTFPCIIHWDMNHFVVLNGFRNGKAYINDPAKGNWRLSMKDFDRSFTGICLQFKPTEVFCPSGKPKSMLSFAAKRLKGTGTAIVFSLLVGVIASLMSLISPVFSRVLLDHLLNGKNPDWTVPFLVFLGGFDLVQIVMSALQDIYARRINGKMAVVGNSAYMWKVLKMPQKFFSQRMAGDIQERQNSNASIANTLINTFSPLLLHAVMLILYFLIMIRYSMLLTMIGLSALAINAAVSRYISKKRINITRVSMRDTAKLAAATVSGIEMIETIKASGAEDGYFKKWSGIQANVNTQQVKYLKLNQYLGMIPQFLSALANDIILILGVWLTIQGEFTVGMVMAFQGFLSSFMSPALTLISAGQTLQEMRTQMERIDDVMEYPEENRFAENDSQEEGKKLSGRIAVKDVVFGYSPLSDPIIRDFNLNLEPGKSIAIVGGSGSGKSTVAKLISGLYQPWSGEILFDGKPMKQIDKDVFRSSLAVVDQDIILFEDTIENNIKMWDTSIEDFEMILAARDAQIHEDIVQRPQGYQHKLIEGGKDFSGGQRQRLEIARVLAQDPSVIILDEATSALDAITEYKIIQAIRDRGVACIVVAHRLSTVRTCDEILVLDHGEIAERGTHDSLMEKNGLYKTLVSAE